MGFFTAAVKKGFTKDPYAEHKRMAKIARKEARHEAAIRQGVTEFRSIYGNDRKREAVLEKRLRALPPKKSIITQILDATAQAGSQNPAPRTKSHSKRKSFSYDEYDYHEKKKKDNPYYFGPFG